MSEDDVDDERLLSHGLRVVSIVNQVVANMDEPSKIDTILDNLGRRHVNYSVKPEMVPVSSTFSRFQLEMQKSSFHENVRILETENSRCWSSYSFNLSCNFRSRESGSPRVQINSKAHMNARQTTAQQAEFNCHKHKDSTKKRAKNIDYQFQRKSISTLRAFFKIL